MDNSKDISMGDLKVQRIDYTNIRFLKIPLKHETKTVEVTTNTDKVAQLKTKNDFLLLKYILELKCIHMEKRLKKESKQTPTTVDPTEEDIIMTDNVPENVFDSMQEDSITTIGTNPKDTFEGILRIKNSDRRSQQQFIDIPLFMYEYEAWVKNDKDYYTLYKEMKDWEIQNMDYISELTEIESFFNNTPNKNSVATSSVYAKTKNT